MWQKFLYLCFFLIISGMFSQAYSQTVEVESLSNFSTYNPPSSITVKLVEPLVLLPSLTLDAGGYLSGTLVDVVSPKRLKRDASFSFKPETYTTVDGEIHNLDIDVIASYTVPLDKGQFAKNAALGVGNFFVKGLSMGVAAVKGAVQNEEENRIKSSAVSVYEASPFSYVEKGEDLDIKFSQSFYLKFPNPEKLQNSVEKGQNYTYTIEKE